MFARSENLGITVVLRPNAAIACKHGALPRGVYENHVGELQQALLKDGCYLLGVKNEDGNDLALSAEASASSETPGAAAGNAIDGWNRVVGEDRNAWAPDPASTGPQWVRLRLPTVQSFDTVHVTFENESVDCLIQTLVNGAWKTAASVSELEGRRIVRHFPPARSGSLRLLFDTTSPSTAVCEIRIYSERENSGSAR